MNSNDFIVKLPPKKKYTVNVIVRDIKRGKPRVISDKELKELEAISNLFGEKD